MGPVGPEILGPENIGPENRGPKMVGPKIVGPVGPEIFGIAASVFTQLRRKWNRWIHIKNPNSGMYKYVENEQYLTDLYRAGLF